MLKYCLLILLTLSLISCEEESLNNHAKNNLESVKLCKEKGGVPIYDAWNFLEDCKFPNDEKNEKTDKN